MKAVLLNLEHARSLLAMGPPIYGTPDQKAAYAALATAVYDEPPAEWDPPWHQLRSVLASIDAKVAVARPFNRHLLDQAAALQRDGFDKLGLSVADEQVLYAAFVTLSVLLDFVTQGWHDGLIHLGIVQAVAVAVQSFASSLVTFVPAEVLR